MRPRSVLPVRFQGGSSLGAEANPPPAVPSTSSSTPHPSAHRDSVCVAFARTTTSTTGQTSHPTPCRPNCSPRPPRTKSSPAPPGTTSARIQPQRHEHPRLRPSFEPSSKQIQHVLPLRVLGARIDPTAPGLFVFLAGLRQASAMIVRRRGELGRDDLAIGRRATRRAARGERRRAARARARTAASGFGYARSSSSRA